ncbi:hypothetical protein, partial [Terrisporobacter sp.]|uniref:hypothetical protein n=1 Tax=Terrisporobacter sp. TaxID=1965305 RepID=UPI002A8384A0
NVTDGVVYVSSYSYDDCADAYVVEQDANVITVISRIKKYLILFISLKIFNIYILVYVKILWVNPYLLI